jgi:spore germination protein
VRRWILALLLALLPTTAHADGRRFLAYYVEWDSRSWVSLSESWDAVDVVAAQWVWVDPCGGLTSRDDQTLKAEAAGRHVPVLPSLFTFSKWLNSRLLAEPTATGLVENIVRYVEVEGYAGFDLDLEDIAPTDRDAYTSLVARLAEALHARGKWLAIAVPPKERELPDGFAAAYDYAALGQHADQILLMTYEYAGAWSGPGPVAPYQPVERAMAYAASLIPAAKLNLGVAFYGYDWNLSRPGQVRAVGFPEALAIADRYKPAIGLDPLARSITWRHEARAGDPVAQGSAGPRLRNHITPRSAPRCDVPYPPRPTPGPTPVPPPPDTVEEHVVWLEEARAAEARLAIASRLGTGVGAWRLGQEDPDVWPIIRSWRAGS